MQIKKLQVEHAKRIHELGKQTFAWYRSGTMIVSGPVPREVVDVCAQLDATQKQLDETQRELDVAREQARNAMAATNPDSPSSASSTPPPALAPPASPDANSTVRLNRQTDDR